MSFSSTCWQVGLKGRIPGECAVDLHQIVKDPKIYFNKHFVKIVKANVNSEELFRVLAKILVVFKIYFLQYVNEKYIFGTNVVKNRFSGFITDVIENPLFYIQGTELKNGYFKQELIAFFV